MDADMTSRSALVDTFGDTFLAYVLAVSPVDVVSWAQGAIELSGEQNATVTALAELATITADQDASARSYVLAQVGNYNAELECSWAHAARVANRGEFELPTTSDDVVRTLYGIARDVYPLFLLPRADAYWGFRGPELTAPVYSHPARKQLDDDVIADAVLGRMFGQESDTSVGTAPFIPAAAPVAAFS